MSTERLRNHLVRFLLAVLIASLMPVSVVGQQAGGAVAKKLLSRNKYLDARAGNTNENPAVLRLKAFEFFNEAREFQLPPNFFKGDWTLLGPETVVLDGNPPKHLGRLGRTNTLAQHPTRPNMIFAGTGAGGLWRSENWGESWHLLSDHTAGASTIGQLLDALALISSSSIVIDHTNPDTMYVLTGDGNASLAPVASVRASIGVMKTTDAGKNWEMKSKGFVRYPQYGFKLVMDLENNEVLLAATSAGIFRTENGGDEWAKQIDGLFVDVDFKPMSVEGVVEPEVCRSVYAYGTTTEGFYRAIREDGKIVWQKHADVPDGRPDLRRVEVAVQENNPNAVYAVYAGSDGLVGLYFSDDCGETFELRSNAPNILGYKPDGSSESSAAFFALAIAVSPENLDEVYVGAANIWQSLDGGRTWKVKSYWRYQQDRYPYVHTDIHALEFGYRNEKPVLLAATDGGVSMTENGGNDWLDLSQGLSISEVYRVCGHPGDPSILYYGAQDNGTNRLLDKVGTPISGGDGGPCAVDFENPEIVYSSENSGTLFRTVGGGEAVSVTPPTTESGAWNTPFIMDPADSKTLYACYEDLWRTNDGGQTWTNLTDGKLGDETCVAIAVAEASPEHLYVAKQRDLYWSIDNGKTWINATPPMPVGDTTITDIAVSSEQPQRIWVTLGGYVRDQKVFETVDGGFSWTNISNGLWDIPVETIIYEGKVGDISPHGLYVGTDLGVFYRSDALCGNTPPPNPACPWVPFVNGLPPLIVLDLEISGNKLRAATLGRGVWESPLFASYPNAMQALPEKFFKAPAHLDEMFRKMQEGGDGPLGKLGPRGKSSSDE